MPLKGSRELPCPLLCVSTQRDDTVYGGAGPHTPESAGISIVDFQPPELWERNTYCLSRQWGILLQRLKQTKKIPP